ncbi:MAG: hypothetical protein ACT4P9_13695 [Betaproteobacteria bacterium]
MRALLRPLSLLLMLLVAAIVLSPRFGWEAAANQGPHSELATEPGIDCDPQAPEPIHDPAQRSAHEHHGCLGHLLGHLAFLIEPREIVFAVRNDDEPVRWHGREPRTRHARIPEHPPKPSPSA